MHPFEPPRRGSLLDKKLTSYKTVFLLALAIGARRGNRHALSRQPRDFTILKLLKYYTILKFRCISRLRS